VNSQIITSFALSLKIIIILNFESNDFIGYQQPIGQPERQLESLVVVRGSRFQQHPPDNATLAIATQFDRFFS
jgi:hypothetical protein